MHEFKAVVILVVEDDPGDQKLIKQSLRNDRVANELRMAGSAGKAMEYLECSKAGDEDYPMPDLILLDLNMPGVGGKEFLRTVKADPQLDTIPVVILTTSDSEKDILESFRLQAAGYVRKPVTLQEFQKVLSELADYWFLVCKQVEHSKAQTYDRNLCITN